MADTTQEDRIKTLARDAAKQWFHDPSCEKHMRADIEELSAIIAAALDKYAEACSQQAHLRLCWMIREDTHVCPSDGDEMVWYARSSKTRPVCAKTCVGAIDAAMQAEDGGEDTR